MANIYMGPSIFCSLYLDVWYSYFVSGFGFELGTTIKKTGYFLGVFFFLVNTVSKYPHVGVEPWQGGKERNKQSRGHFHCFYILQFEHGISISYLQRTNIDLNFVAVISIRSRERERSFFCSIVNR